MFGVYNSTHIIGGNDNTVYIKETTHHNDQDSLNMNLRWHKVKNQKIKFQSQSQWKLDKNIIKQEIQCKFYSH